MEVKISIEINGKKIGVMSNDSGGNLNLSDYEKACLGMEICKQAILNKIGGSPLTSLKGVEVTNEY